MTLSCQRDSEPRAKMTIEAESKMLRPTCGHAGFYLLWGADTSRGFRVISHKVSYADGFRKVEQGVWREYRDPVSCELMGFQVISSAAVRGDKDLKSAGGDYNGSIYADEMQANAGCLGKSQTAKLSEDERAGHKGRDGQLEPEDFIERTKRKVFVFPLVGSSVGDILIAWPRSR
jgi:hypothetical protein